MSRTGELAMNHEYTGVKERNGYLKTVLKGRRSYQVLDVEKSQTSVIKGREYKIEVDNDSDMQLLRMSWDKNKYAGYEYGSASIIRYGTKVHVSSERITFTDLHVLGHGMKTTITPF